MMMLTPQEVSEKKFAKAVFGGYDMSEVDDFLDALAADYDKLFKDTAVLKGKLKALAQKVEEYRAVDEELRKTLVAAKRQTDEQIANAAAEAAETVAAARKEADELLTVTRAEAEELSTRTRMNADELSAKAKEMYDELTARARHESEELMSGARGESERLINEARSTAESLAAKAHELNDAAISRARRDSEALMSETKHKCENMLLESRGETESYLTRIRSQIELEEARLSAIQSKLKTYVGRAAEACSAHIEALTATVKATEDELGISASYRVFEVPPSEPPSDEPAKAQSDEQPQDAEQCIDQPTNDEVIDIESFQLVDVPQTVETDDDDDDDDDDGETVAAFAPYVADDRITERPDEPHSYDFGGVVVEMSDSEQTRDDGVFDDIFN